MAETPEDEVTHDDIEVVEEPPEAAEDGASLDDEIMEDNLEEVGEDLSPLLASFEADLEFLHGSNMSFYQANKAYYEDRNYEDAISEFQAAIEYEKSQSPVSSGSKNRTRRETPNEVIAKSMYWLGESHIKLNQIDEAVETFGQLAKHYSQHYLAPAAQRRLASLGFDAESESV